MAAGIQGQEKDREVVETERQLLDAIRRGERDALRRLYDRYSRYAMAVGLRFIHDKGEMEDVLQDCFLSILSTIGNFEYRGEGSLKAWVSRIVTNHSIDWIKEHERMMFTDVFPDETEETNETIPEIDDIPPDILNTMIKRLPVGCRTVLNLHVFEQLTHREIGQRLNIKEKTSHSQYAYAKRLLAEMIRKYLNSQMR